MSRPYRVTRTGAAGAWPVAVERTVGTYGSLAAAIAGAQPRGWV